MAWLPSWPLFHVKPQRLPEASQSKWETVWRDSTWGSGQGILQSEPTDLQTTNRRWQLLETNYCLLAALLLLHDASVETSDPNSQARDDDSYGCDPNNGLRRLKWQPITTLLKPGPQKAWIFLASKLHSPAWHFVQEAVAVHAALLWKTPEIFPACSMFGANWSISVDEFPDCSLLNYSISHYQNPNSSIFRHTEDHQKFLLQILSIEEYSNQEGSRDWGLESMVTYPVLVNSMPMRQMKWSWNLLCKSVISKALGAVSLWHTPLVDSSLKFKSSFSKDCVGCKCSNSSECRIARSSDGSTGNWLTCYWFCRNTKWQPWV